MNPEIRPLLKQIFCLHRTRRLVHHSLQEPGGLFTYQSEKCTRCGHHRLPDAS